METLKAWKPGIIVDVVKSGEIFQVNVEGDESEDSRGKENHFKGVCV